MGKPSRAFGLDAALVLYMLFYCGVAGSFGLGLYALLRPAQTQNIGLAAYTPPPATVVNYDAVRRLAPDPMPVVAAAEPEVTVAAKPVVEEPKPTVKVKKTRERTRHAARKSQRRRNDYWVWTRDRGWNRYAGRSGWGGGSGWSGYHPW
jgi:hypothetical protein